MIAVVDYSAGNLTSVKLAFAAIGCEVTLTRDPLVIAKADRVVFPGVGAAGSAMANLRNMGLIDAVRSAACSCRPFLGICLGMQILFDHTEEDGGVDLLGVISGQVRRFPSDAGVKIPQIGWNSVNGDEAYYYFVHSYYVEKGSYTVGLTDYAGVEFSSMVRRGSLLACQFHPEKSGRLGLQLLKDWASC